jgi:uncharacterized protein (TIGR03067 family)
MWGLVIVTAVVLVAGDDAKLTTEVIKRLQGDWQVESAQRDGKKVDGADKITWKIDEKKIVITRNGKEEKATFELVTEKVDDTFSGGNLDMFLTEKSETVLGIYWLEADRLLLNFAPPGEKRPKGYVPDKGDKGQFWVLDRVKKK